MGLRHTAVAAALVAALALSLSTRAAAQSAEAELERVLKQIEQAQAQVEALEKRIADLDARRARLRLAADLELSRAAVNDMGAIERILAEKLVSTAFVDYVWAVPMRDFKGDRTQLVKLIESRLPLAEPPAVRANLCWALGFVGSKEAAAVLRQVLATEADPTAISNAIAAILRCPPDPKNTEAVERHRTNTKQPRMGLGFCTPATIAEQVNDALPVDPVNATRPLDVIVEEPTFHCLGFEWRIEGDDNRNCRVNVDFRRKGAKEWHEAQPLLRVENRANRTYKISPGNLLAGSVLALDPGTSYEVRLRLSDPDGGNAEKTLAVATRPLLPDGYKGRVRHVVPGDGRGSGTEDDPFKGIEAADAAAEPGDIMLLHAGHYGANLIIRKKGTKEKPIVWRGVDRSKVIIGGTAKKAERRALRLDRATHLVLENVTVCHARDCISAYNATGLVVRRCHIHGARYVGLVAQGQTRNCVFCDSVIEGPAKWPLRKGSSWGVCVNGNGNIVCHNRITDFWDAISLAQNRPYRSQSSNDVYHNELIRCTDDGVEADYVFHNTRIWGNRITNVLCAVSCQPVFGGPSYILRNMMYNCTGKPFKLHVFPSGMVIAHNTSYTTGRANPAGSWWRNAAFRNNLLIGSAGYAMETEGALADLDYNGWTKTDADRFFKFNHVRYLDLAAWTQGTGMGRHSLILTPAVFQRTSPPVRENRYTPTDYDFRLKPGSTGIDAGVRLPNINDGFTGKAPDLGCCEYGKPVPRYGVRGE